MRRGRKLDAAGKVISVLRALLIVALGLAVLAVACEEEEVTIVSTPAAGEEEEATPEETSEARVGDTVKSGDYILTVRSVTDPYQAEEGFRQPEAGKRCVLADVLIENGGGGGISLIMTDFVLLDEENFVYESSFVSCAGPNELDMLTTLGAGEKTAGTVAFEVPEGSTITTVKYRIPFEGDILVGVQ